VNIFVRGAFEKGRRARLRENLLEGFDHASTLIRSEDADTLQRARKRLRAANIGVDQPPIEME
jgi:hypothetical protein